MRRKFTSIPQFDTSASNTGSDDRRFTIMKGAVWSELVQQPCIRKAFASWHIATGLLRRADDVARISDQLAKAMKLPSRASLNPTDGSGVDMSGSSKQVRKLAAQREAAIVCFRESLNSVSQTLGPAPFTTAQKVGLPYTWVGQGLLVGFVAEMEALVVGQEVVLPLPQIMVTYDPMQERPTGRKPDEAALVRYGEWYVRHRVSGISVNKLAKEYHQAHHTHPNYRKDHTWMNDRKTVSEGIEEIDRLLKLTPADQHLST